MMQEWFSRKDAAKYIGVSPTTIWRWATQGIIKVHYLPNGDKRYSKSELDKMLEKEVASYGA